MTNSNPLISVIIPVYNLGSFLSPCVESLLGQTYQNLEILLVDDGSTDGSGALCDTFGEKDSRIRVIHTANGGVGSTRNLGLDAAQGEYIAFVDGDDWVKPDYFEVLYRDLTAQGADAAFCNYLSVDEEGNALPNQHIRFPAAERIDSLETLLLAEEQLRFHSACAALFCAKSVGQLRFPDLRYGEDAMFMFHWLCTSPVVTVNPYPGYAYVIRKNSAMHDKRTPNIVRYKSALAAYTYKCANLPTASPAVRKVFINKYAHTLHVNIYLSALKENRLLKTEDLEKHIANILPDIHLLPKKLRFFISLYAKAPWLYNLLAQIKHTLHR